MPSSSLHSHTPTPLHPQPLHQPISILLFILLSIPPSEHSWPKSWWGGFSKGQGAQTDLFELYPSDGYVNGLRSNLPLGTVGKATYTSTSGAKIGACTTTGFTSTCFEPPDEWKGQLSRSYFYLSTAYSGKWSCCNADGVDGSSIKPWMEKQLRTWHAKYPVTDHDNKVNDLVFGIQKNRNPFIDHPEWVAMIKDF